MITQSSIATTPSFKAPPSGDFWEWKGHKIRYRSAVDSNGAKDNPIVILVHGFGGNCEHWRKNLPDVRA
eukprot:681843-Amorphochlora_amoeboformis.AAC.1